MRVAIAILIKRGCLGCGVPFPFLSVSTRHVSDDFHFVLSHTFVFQNKKVGYERCRSRSPESATLQSPPLFRQIFTPSGVSFQGHRKSLSALLNDHLIGCELHFQSVPHNYPAMLHAQHRFTASVSQNVLRSLVYCLLHSQWLAWASKDLSSPIIPCRSRSTASERALGTSKHPSKYHQHGGGGVKHQTQQQEFALTQLKNQNRLQFMTAEASCVGV